VLLFFQGQSSVSFF